jgi:hypothetical protein
MDKYESIDLIIYLNAMIYLEDNVLFPTMIAKNLARNPLYILRI